MIKQDFVERVADATGLNKVMVKTVVDTFLLEVKKALCDGRRIELRNFGVFIARKRRPRIGRNPRTGEQVRVPERVRVCFKPSRCFFQTTSDEENLFPPVPETPDSPGTTRQD